jgi:hypothetical protein
MVDISIDSAEKIGDLAKTGKINYPGASGGYGAS